MPLFPAPSMRLRAMTSPRIEHVDGNIRGLGDRRVDHLAIDRNADDAVAPGAPDLAIGDLDAPAAFQLHESAPLRQWPLGAIEHEPGQRHMIRTSGRNEGGAFGQNQLGRATHADELRAGRKLQIAGAIDAGRDGERAARARGLVDGALQGAALVVGMAGAHPELPASTPSAEIGDAAGARAGDTAALAPAVAAVNARRWRRSRSMASAPMGPYPLQNQSQKPCAEAESPGKCLWR